MSLDLSAIKSLTGGTSSTPSADSSAALGQNEFLKLMLAQLKNQDPMKPMDPSEFLSQLAQFSTVTATENMSSTMTGLASSMLSSQVLSGTNLMGRDVLAAGDTATLPAGGTVRGAVDVPSGVSSLAVNVLDSSGQLVRQFSITPDSGLVDFTWDGKTNSGEVASAGTYKFQVVAGSGGQNAALDPLLASHVNSVTIDPSTHELSLNTNNGTLALSDVRRIM